jgi:adenylate cyclase
MAGREDRRAATAMSGDDTPVPSGDEEVARTLGELGIPAEVIRRAAERGDPEGAIFDAVLLPAIGERTVSAEQIESGGGLSAAEVIAIMEAFGLPAPDPSHPAFTPEEASVFVEMARVRDVWPENIALQLARVEGRLLARIAQTELQLFRIYVEPELRDEEDRLRGLRAVQSAFARLFPLADPLLVAVHRRWIEHELGQAVVREAEAGAGERRLPGTVEVAFLFCDLKDFTAYADLQGDAAAVEAIDRFVEIVMRERGDQVRLMKALGDGYMLAYGDSSKAVEAGNRIVAAAEASEGPGVHASAHEGVAIAREGDYFGGAVNLAARLLAAAGRDELVATEPVVRGTEDAFDWEAAGALRVRGVSEPVEIFRLVR